MSQFKGAGGGGGGKKYDNRKDTLFSVDTVEIVLGISEGPIKGLVEGSKSYYVGETPLKSVDGTENFKDFYLGVYPGKDTDPAVTYRLGGEASNYPVSVRLAKNVPVTRTTPNGMRKTANTPGFDRIEVRLQFNQLVLTNDEGSYENTAQFRIMYKPSNSSTWSYYNGETTTSIYGKTMGGYVREFVIPVTPLSDADYDIRIEKLSPDNDSVNVVDISWESYQLVTSSSRKYQNVALVHLIGQATSQFSSIPDFSGIFEGLIIDVPTNYDPVTRTYNEITPWNGATKKAYCNNNAWVLWNLIMNTTYGLKKHYPHVTANIYSFYEAAKWCDQIMMDGKPRFTFNEEIKDPRNGMELLQYVAGSFDATIYDDHTGVVHLKVDMWREPKMLFVPENVTEDGFNYTYTDPTTWYNDVTVGFVNPNLNWSEDRRRVFKQEYIDKLGRIPYDFVAVGCTDADEAIRRARMRMITANTEKAQVSFRTTRLGMLLDPLDYIYVADPVMGWSATGRIKDISHKNLVRNSGFTLDTNPVNNLPDYWGVYNNAGVSNVALWSTDTDGKKQTGVRFTASSTSTHGIHQPGAISSEWKPGVDYIVSFYAKKVNGSAFTNMGLCWNGTPNTTTISNPNLTTSYQRYVFKINFPVHYANNHTSGLGNIWISRNGTSVAGDEVWFKDVMVTEGSDVLDYTPRMDEAYPIFTLRDPIYMTGPGQVPIKIQGYDGVYSVTAFSTTGGDVTSFQVISGTLPAILPPQPTFSIEDATQFGMAKPFRVVSVERPEPDNQYLYQISAIEVNRNKWSDVNTGQDSGTVTYSYKNPMNPVQASNLTLESGTNHLQVLADGTVISRIFAQWSVPKKSNVSKFEVQYREVGAPTWMQLTTDDTSIYIPNVRDGAQYEVAIISVGPFGSRSAATLAPAHTVIGKTEPPSNVTGFTSNLVDSRFRLVWSRIADLDLDGYEIRRGSSWDTATPVVVLGKVEFYNLPPLTVGQYDYLIKAVDTSKNQSLSATKLTLAVEAPESVTPTFAYSGTDVVISWPVPESTFGIQNYEVRYGSVNGDYAGSTFLANTSSPNLRLAVTWKGSRRFFVKVLDQGGNSSTPVALDISFNGGSISFSPVEIIGTNTTIRWLATAGALPIDHFKIRKGNSWATGKDVAETAALFAPINELVAGSYIYWVCPVDTAGNEGIPSSITITVGVPEQVSVMNKFSGPDLLLDWNVPDATFPVSGYEIRYANIGQTYAASTFLATVQATSFRTRVNWTGNRRFFVTAIDSGGNKGVAAQVDVYVQAPVADNLSAEVIDNNVLLRWTVAEKSLPVDKILIKKGTTLATATVVGSNSSGTFAALFETTSGTYRYWAVPVDTAGNEGTSDFVDALVNQPPDYVLNVNWNSTFSGTKTNLLRDTDGSAYGPVYVTQTYQQKFATYTSFQAMMAAGYLPYATPGLTSFTYEETFDYGTVLGSTMIKAIISKDILAGSISSEQVTISVRKLVTAAWQDNVGVTQIYAADVRYVKVKYVVTVPNDKCLVRVRALQVRLDSKLKNDGGKATANAGDVGGTQVNFNVPFIDVTSITVTPQTTQPVFSSYDFVDVPNPTSFKVLIFDKNGTRVTCPFSWSVKGY